MDIQPDREHDCIGKAQFIRTELQQAYALLSGLTGMGVPAIAVQEKADGTIAQLETLLDELSVLASGCNERARDAVKRVGGWAE